MDYRRIKHIFLVLPALLLAFACQQKYEIFDELGIVSHTLNIAETPGETHIAVYSTGAWKVALDREVDWASLNKLSGEGMGDFVLSWSANYGTARSVDILVSRGRRTERINVIQAGYITNPYITLGAAKVALPKQAASHTVSLATNLEFNRDDFKARAVYYNGSATDTLEIGSSSEKAWVSAFSIQPDSFSFSVLPNESGLDRSASVICYTVDAAGVETKASVMVEQSASGPVFVLSEDSGEYFANNASYIIPAEQNNIWSLDGITVSSEARWIGDMAVTEHGLSFSLYENTSDAPRSATVKVSYNSADGSVAGDSFTVNQAPEKQLSFREVRGMLPGKMSGKIFIEGFIVSDPASPNVCSSPQTGQYAFDRTENSRTAYIESTEADFGFCIKFTDASENIAPAHSKVHISLDGLTLERETTPLRFTLRGVQASNIKILEENAAVPEKQRNIAQLTEADIYTLVSLQSVEIMCKDGSFTNASEGYSLKDTLNPNGSASPRWDVAPLLCYDANGDAIHILTNAAAPWRRTGLDLSWGSCVPQGSGTLKGVVVYDEVAPVRWGNLGKYQIRPMSREDIDLEAAPFANTICEWNWNDRDQKAGTDIGKGSLSHYDAATSFAQDYNNPYLPEEGSDANGGGDSNLKGLVANGAYCLKQAWWDPATGEGKYFDIDFPTSGLSGNAILFGIVWGHGLGNTTTINAPSHWNVLYSVDGGLNFKPAGTMIKQRSCAWWSQTSNDCAPGYTEHLIKLPANCFGKSKVVVRLQAADDVTDIAPSTSASTWAKAIGIEKGKLTASDKGSVRIGTITVRYI